MQLPTSVGVSSRLDGIPMESAVKHISDDLDDAMNQFASAVGPGGSRVAPSMTPTRQNPNSNLLAPDVVGSSALRTVAPVSDTATYDFGSSRLAPEDFPSNANAGRQPTPSEVQHAFGSPMLAPRFHAAPTANIGPAQLMVPASGPSIADQLRLHRATWAAHRPAVPSHVGFVPQNSHTMYAQSYSGAALAAQASFGNTGQRAATTLDFSNAATRQRLSGAHAAPSAFGNGPSTLVQQSIDMNRHQINSTLDHAERKRLEIERRSLRLASTNNSPRHRPIFGID